MKTFLIGLLCFGIALPSFGCSCFFQPMSIKKVINYDLVFLGQVVKDNTVSLDQKKEADGISTPFSMDDIAYTFKIKEVIKGKTSEKEVTIYTASSGAACGTSFAMGETYYVYATSYQGKYNTGLCANNQRQSSVTKAYKKIICNYKKKRRARDWKNIEGQSIANGKVKKINGERVPIGNWTFYHPDGSIESIGLFIKGKKQGEWNYYLDKESSKAKISELTEEKRQEIKQPENMLMRREVYEDGVRKEMDYMLD